MEAFGTVPGMTRETDKAKGSHRSAEAAFQGWGVVPIGASVLTGLQTDWCRKGSNHIGKELQQRGDLVDDHTRPC